MSTSLHPSGAATLPHLLRIQINISYPGRSIAEAADEIRMSRHTLYSWSCGQRTPRAETLRDVLRRLGADDATVAAALMLLATPGGQ